MSDEMQYSFSDALDFDEVISHGLGLGTTTLTASPSSTATSFAHVSFNPSTRAFRLRADVHNPIALSSRGPFMVANHRVSPHISASCTQTSGYLSGGACVWKTKPGEDDVALRSLWTNMVFLAEKGKDTSLDRHAVFKCEYASAKNCLQLMGSSESGLIGINMLRSVGKSSAVGMELFKSLSKGDTTFSLGYRYRRELHHLAPTPVPPLPVSLSPPPPSPTSLEASMTVSSFGHLTASTFVPITPQFALSGRVCYTIPPPSAMRLGAKADHPEASLGVLLRPEDGSWVARCAWAGLRTVRCNFEGHLTNSVSIVGSFEIPTGTGSSPIDGLRWGLTGMLRL